MRKRILDGELTVDVLRHDPIGALTAPLLQRDGKILMVKDCPIHGHFEDVMAIDPAFFAHLEEVFPVRDIRAHADKGLHNHGSSTVTHGRGSVLTIDDQPVVNNDGKHPLVEQGGTVALQKGYHKFTLKYFDAGQVCALRVYMSTPGKPKGELSPDSLYN